jgi:hypothetical protein
VHEKELVVPVYMPVEFEMYDAEDLANELDVTSKAKKNASPNIPPETATRPDPDELSIRGDIFA